MIRRLKFSIEIKGDKETIWKALWDDSSYRDWVSVFLDGSYAVTEDWKEGSTVHFLGPDQSGIYSIIERHIPNQTIHFKHIGMVAEGKEQSLNEDTKKWSGTIEIYTLTSAEKAHTLTVEIDIMDEHLEFMSSTFPKALERIKANCH